MPPKKGKNIKNGHGFDRREKRIFDGKEQCVNIAHWAKAQNIRSRVE